MESLCIIQEDGNSKNAKVHRVCDFANGKLIDMIPKPPFDLNYDHSVTLPIGNAAIWEWSKDVWAKESESSNLLCEIIKVDLSNTKSEKGVRRALRLNLKEGFKLQHPVDCRRKLLIVFKSNELEGVLLDSESYTYENGIVKLNETDDVLQNVSFYKVSNKNLVKSNSALMLQFRRDFILTTDLIPLESVLLIKEADEIASYFLGKYKNIIAKKSRRSVGASKLIDDLLSSDTLKSAYPKDLKIEQYFRDEEVSKVLEDRLIGKDPDEEIIDAYLKSNESFAKICENRIRDDVLGKIRKEIDSEQKKLDILTKKLQDANNKKDAAENDVAVAKQNIAAITKEKERISKDIDDLNSVLSKLNSQYDAKKKELDSQYELYKVELSLKRKDLSEQIENLQKEIAGLLSSKSSLEEELEQFKTTFGTSALNESVLSILIKEISKNGREQTEYLINELKNIVPAPIQNTPIVASSDPKRTDFIFENGDSLGTPEECDLDSLEDYLENNLKDCGLSTKSASDLMDYLLAAIISQRSLIVCGDTHDCVANSLSASLQGTTCDRIIVAGNDVLGILNALQNTSGRIVSIDGVFNSLDYNLYFTLIKNSKKRLIFACNDKKLLQAAPTEIWSSSVLVDLTQEGLLNGSPKHPSKLVSADRSDVKSDNSVKIQKVLSENNICSKELISGISSFLDRVCEYNSNLSGRYLDNFFKFLSKVSELNCDD